jgi:hypothetical protein
LHHTFRANSAILDPETNPFALALKRTATAKRWQGITLLDARLGKDANRAPAFLRHD